MRENECRKCIFGQTDFFEECSRPMYNCDSCILSSGFRKARTGLRRLKHRPGVGDDRVTFKANIITGLPPKRG